MKVGMWWGGMWEGYYPLTLQNIMEVPTEPGVYILSAFNSSVDERPSIIQRCLRKDRFGILYIGKACNLRKRLHCLRNSINSGSKAHDAGFMYNLILELQRFNQDSPKLQTKFPLEGLRFAYILSTEWKVKEDESGALRHYLSKYGELPPLNHQLNRAKWK